MRFVRFVREEIGVAGYVRCTDDSALPVVSRAELRRALGQVERFVRTDQQLALEARATILPPVFQGLPSLAGACTAERGVCDPRTLPRA